MVFSWEVEVSKDGFGCSGIELVCRLIIGFGREVRLDLVL